MKKDRKHVLVLDDEMDIRFILDSILKKEGFYVTQCESISEAKEKIQSNEYHLYILDLNLKDGNGFEVAEFILKQGVKQPIVVISAYEGLLEQEQLDKFQVEAFLKKPFKKNDVLNAISRVIK